MTTRPPRLAAVVALVFLFHTGVSSGSESQDRITELGVELFECSGRIGVLSIAENSDFGIWMSQITDWSMYFSGMYLAKTSRRELHEDSLTHLAVVEKALAEQHRRKASSTYEDFLSCFMLVQKHTGTHVNDKQVFTRIWNLLDEGNYASASRLIDDAELIPSAEAMATYRIENPEMELTFHRAMADWATWQYATRKQLIDFFESQREP